MSGFVRNGFVHEALMHHPSSTLAYQSTAPRPKPVPFAHRIRCRLNSICGL
jgi:hypothetical protein